MKLSLPYPSTSRSVLCAANNSSSVHCFPHSGHRVAVRPVRLYPQVGHVTAVVEEELTLARRSAAVSRQMNTVAISQAIGANIEPQNAPNVPREPRTTISAAIPSKIAPPTAQSAATSVPANRRRVHCTEPLQSATQ